MSPKSRWECYPHILNHSWKRNIAIVTFDNLLKTVPNAEKEYMSSVKIMLYSFCLIVKDFILFNRW